MHMIRKLFQVFTLCLILTPETGQAETHHQSIKNFLNAYCIECHGIGEQHADRRFDQLSFDFSIPQNGELLQEILDQLNLGQMPPKDQPQPDSQSLRQMVDILTQTLTQAREESRSHLAGEVILRRLNRTEYRNTVRDLLQVNMTDFDPTVAFPQDESIDGFDNIGEGLLTSEFLLTQYLNAAEQVINKAIVPGEKPRVEHLIAEGDDIHGGGHSDQRGFKRMLVRDQFTRALIKRKYAGVPADGEYRFKITANTVRWRDHRFDWGELGYDGSEPPRIRVLVTNRKLGVVSTRTFGEYEIKEDQPTTIKIRGYLQKGYEFAVEWANGPRGSQKRIMRKVFPKYLPEDTVELARNPVEMYMGAAPELRLHRLELEGPFYDQWPLPGFTRFFKDLPDRPLQADLDRSLTEFARLAWRGRIDEQALARYLRLGKQRFESTGNFWQAAKLSMKAILASPNFLYLVEPRSEKSHPGLSSYELATRLSYFLWSTMPDDILFDLAKTGDLTQPDILEQQVERMLNNPKAEAFLENFSGQWLHLRQLGSMPPDPTKNPSYYADDLEGAMRQETEGLFRHLLMNNESVLRFIDADYTFLNAALSRHYGIMGVSGDQFQRVQLKPEHHRGGLLGHGSILTLTSNGVETQPVMRGIWVLENMLGSPPSPPPPDVQPVEPDTRGVKTIRELMAKHRSIETCNTCHRKIDPIGLAMENFDHLGRYRQRYSTQGPIDAYGEMPDGTGFNGLNGIRNYLLERPEQFVRCLTEKLLTYAIGRRIAYVDRVDVEKIVSLSKKQDYAFQDLIKLIVTSQAFQSR